ncbi:MAG: RodZ domain-containing protein [Nitrospirota bacterium]|nr:RodZ domain-containing protein [Nitrospirota bacterium]
MLGEYLKKHREEANHTLKEISLITRIRCEYLKALENEEFGKIPGEFFVKGYIKEFLKAISIEPSEAIRLYEEQMKANLAAQEPLPPPRKKKLPPQVFLYPLVVLLIVVPLIMLYPHNKSPEDLNGKVKKESRIDRVVTMIPNPVAPAEADYTNEHVLEITAVEDTWIYLKIDDNLSYSMILEPGQKRIWTGDRQFFLKVGNAGGIRLTFDGKEIGAPGKRGHVVKLTLPQDIKEIKE